jgi:L-malate glycosyltransferase
VKITLLAEGQNVHTLRWANALSERGCEVHLVSAHPFSPYLTPEVRVHPLQLSAPWSYVLSSSQVRRYLAQIRPDVFHVHYASGYGTLGRLVGYRPYALSVWGADVFDFPQKSALHQRLIVRNLTAADQVCSTSHVMAAQCRSLCPDLSNIRVIAFGVDLDQFRPAEPRLNSSVITIGTVKSLTTKYGIDTLVRGFAQCRSAMREAQPKVAGRLRLRIVGDGPQKKNLKRLANRLGVADVTEFVGAVPHHRVPTELHQLDIYVAVSRLDSESFGVAIVEASACGLPVVVSDAGGLPEVVEHGTTGLVVQRDSPQQLADALTKLVAREDLRAEFGGNGHRLVQQRYEWHGCVDRMLEIYDQLRSGRQRKRAA